MDVDELELRDPTCQHGMDVVRLVQPEYQLPHADWHVVSGRRRVDCLTGGRVDDVVLHVPVRSWGGGSAAHASYKPLVDFADQSFGNRPAFIQPDTYELKS